ncbi:YheC/YheD family protein [Paenibacillus sp. GD4]|uniref:YheC/YheD family protein n=1 Tax=Paenibacillus sp. GD4 TaxID=3068890 RepID=UPI002796AA4B|nr:YheC/YheD family protein [Paenibacillus sp. GD4]MDQ1913358.1 YheC/YheD family protein [Paenibacillus sp. GD4]
MIRKRQWHVKDKWSRHLGLVGHRGLARHIPPTRPLSRSSLSTYLSKYRVNYVKPVFGSFGNRIMKVTKSGSQYLVQREQQAQLVAPKKISKIVFGHTRGGRFLIQKGVSLVKVKGHPADFRLLMLKPKDKWLCMGIMGKVASGTRIVTNYNHGGKAIRFRDSLRLAGLSPKQIRQVQAQMIRVGFMAARKFEKRYKHCRRLGIDFGIDSQRRVWIIEVNTNPFYELFRHHEDRTLYRKIDRYMKIIKREQLSY